MNRKHLILSSVALMSLMALPSCNDDDNSSYELLRPTAIVTVIPNADGSFVMQLDNETQLIPTNLKTSPYGGKEVRALVNYSEDEITHHDYQIRNVNVNWIDSIRTKLPVETLGEQDAEEFGKDPLEIVKDWVTVAEDGYLTLRIRTLWDHPGKKHSINLVTGTNPDDPFELVLRHDAMGDTEGEWGDALIAFNLNKLPKTDSENTKIKLKWESFSGEKTAEFDIQMRSEIKDVEPEKISYSKYVK